MTASRYFPVTLAAALLAGPVIAAPVPAGEPAPPGKRPPTPKELAEGRKAYEAIGGGYFLETAFPEQVYHLFILPRTVKPEDFAKVPDLPFEYWLDIELGPSLPLGTLKRLGRLKNLRRLTVKVPFGPDREKLADLGARLAELAAVPNLDHLSLGGPYGGDLLSDGFAEKVTEFKALRMLAGEGSITDAGLAALARHPALERITLGQCNQITDAGLAHLAKAKALRGLHLWNCPKLTAAGLKPFADDPRLTYLAYGGDNFKEDALAHVEKMWTLEFLNVLHYKDRVLGEAALERIGSLPRLRELHLPRVKLTDAGLAAIAGAGALERLAFYDCSDVTDAGLKALTRLGCLKSLRLHHAPGVTDAGLKDLAKLPRLETLSVSGAPKVTDDGVTALLRAETLTGLHLGETAATEKGARAFVAGRGRRLKELGLRGMPVSDDLVAYLAFEAPDLVDLDLRKCDGVTDKAAAAIANLSNLRYLTFYDTGITKRGFAVLKERLPECRLQGSP